MNASPLFVPVKIGHSRYDDKLSDHCFFFWNNEERCHMHATLEIWLHLVEVRILLREANITIY